MFTIYIFATGFSSYEHFGNIIFFEMWLLFSLMIQGWGKTIILGVEMHGSPLYIASYELLNGRCIMGSMFGGIKPKDDIPTLLNKYLNKAIILFSYNFHSLIYCEFK
jgi:Zn-dependent alcohol dehydrogenase